MTPRPALTLALCLLPATLALAQTAPEWQWAGWGGGGYYYAAAFHPTAAGVAYLGGDVAGVYRTEDHGRSWRLINRGLADYGVFTLAVDPTAPDTVYAATPAGLCKSTDRGDQWRLLPNTGRQGLWLTGEKNKSIRSVAVDPTDGRIVWAGSPVGKLYRSADGGETWQVAWQATVEGDESGTLRVQFGKVNQEWYGGFWTPLTFPADLPAAEVTGFGLTFKGDGRLPRDCFLTLQTAAGVSYRSKNLRELFGQTSLGDVVLAAADFQIDPQWTQKHPDEVAKQPPTPPWEQVARCDFACVGPLMNDASTAWFGRLFYATGGGEPRVIKTFESAAAIRAYANVRPGSPTPGPVYSVATDGRLVLAATDAAGVVLSRDGGRTWTACPTPTRVASVAVAPSAPAVLYAACFADGLWRSDDQGLTWRRTAGKLPDAISLTEVAVSPADPDHVFLIGAAGWNGRFYRSLDGGANWTEVTTLKADPVGNPTLPAESQGNVALSTPKSLAVNPRDPRELLLAANWRPAYSADGGQTWSESSRGADISCVYDIRFHNGLTYACAMDEGVLVSADHGASWRALWPLRWDVELSGHSWRVAISGEPGRERIVSTASPWDSPGPNRVVYSADGGRTFNRSVAGLPEKNPTANTMWGTGYPRALAVDPTDPLTLYLGIDGEPSADRPGGGVFKSTDGGATWAALPAQPGSRRMFFGLAVDPTDRRRLFWAACGAGGGLWRSNDGGASWEHVFKHEAWLFNVHVTADGTVYCPGQNLWRSTDHGQTWRQLTRFPTTGAVIVGLESDPANPDRLWLALTTWSGAADGGVWETTDGGATWHDITGDLAYRKPLVLRYNPQTRELWAAGVTIHKLRR